MNSIIYNIILIPNKENYVELFDNVAGVVSSDDSDMSDCDMLPWQPEWLTPSSDEEAADDDE